MGLYKKYLLESLKEYHFRIKTLKPIDDKAMDAVESVLRKYDLKDATKARKTPLQEHPLEFYNHRNKEVYIIDTVLGMPASPHILQQELKDVLQITEDAIVIRSDNDPIEVYTQKILADSEAYETKLSTSSDYNKDEQITEEPAYGDKYNEKFLSRIARARMKIDSEIKMDDAQYNTGIDGVTPNYSGQSKTEQKNISPTGNYDDDAELKDGVR